MNNTCTYPGNREAVLMAFLYDEIAPAERTAFAAHAATCDRCRGELDGLGEVRTRLAQWTPPALTPMLAHEPAPPPRRARLWSTFRDAPAWMQVAAAMVCLGVGAGAANLDITYTSSGLSVRTGWSRSAADAAQGATTHATVAADISGASVSSDAPVSRADLAALDQQLRSEMRHVSAADATLVRTVRTLIAESERKQQNELALRLAGAFADVEAQRKADLSRIDRAVGNAQNASVREVMRTRQELNSLSNFVRVSQKQ